ncbi:MAG: FadR/GntR family transcriptional regulator [Geminicoccaceae bacterium]
MTAAVDAIRDFIIREGLRPGDRLPAERQLMGRLEVGRSTVREALRQLEGMAVLERRAGSGTYLSRALDEDTVHLQVSLSLQQTELLNGLEIRRGLESEAVALAALRATDDQLERIERSLLALEAYHARHGIGSGKLDVRFHEAIYEAAGNPLFIQLIGSLNDIFRTFFTNPLQQPGFAERSFELHRPLFEAIRDRDPGRARATINAILDIVEEDLRAGA